MSYQEELLFKINSLEVEMEAYLALDDTDDLEEVVYGEYKKVCYQLLVFPKDFRKLLLERFSEKESIESKLPNVTDVEFNRLCVLNSVVGILSQISYEDKGD